MKNNFAPTAEKSRELIQEFQYDRFQNQTPFYFFFATGFFTAGFFAAGFSHCFLGWCFFSHFF
jgi:hypothetical protein